MIKLLAPFAAVIFALFIGAVVLGVMYYSYNALGLIFPGDLAGQLFGMVLFDVAALNWFLVFVKKCESTMQYVFSGLGFMVGLGGTLGLVGIEVGLSSGYLEAGTMAQPLTYIFIVAMISHLVLIYAHHAAAPEISAEISLGVERAKIFANAEKQAERMLTENQNALGKEIADRQVREILRVLEIEPNRAQVLDLPALPVEDIAPAGKPRERVDFLSGLLSGWGKGGRLFGFNAPSVATTSPQPTPAQSPAAGDVARPDGDGSAPKS